MTRRPLIVAANRLPVTRDPVDHNLWRISPGGLVSALAPALEDRETTWVGWTGSADDGTKSFRADGVALEPVELSLADIESYYQGFSNSTLWPLYHDAIVIPQFHRSWWTGYRAVNERFARRIAATAAPGATVWIHDYHLQLVPAILRDMRPDLRIGFFLHIPFPPQEVFLRLPWRSEVLRGVLGADVIGFQTLVGAWNFRQLARRLLGTRSQGEEIFFEGRAVTCGVFPAGIDAGRIEAIAATSQCRAEAEALRTEFGADRQILLGVDRLDYTKGIPVRLRAYAELLSDDLIDPRDAVMVQIAQPTRTDTPGYEEVRAEVDQLVGQINGDYATMTSVAVKYLHQGQSLEQLVALYRSADVMLVTPFRDGMNLVAKEFVAANHDRPASLVLSEFAGAAHQLRSARLVNPFDIVDVKQAILAALAANPGERLRTIKRLAANVRRHDAAWWSTTFLQRLEASQ